MSKAFLRSLLPLTGAVFLSLSAVMPAQATDASALYRCHVVGETKACESLPAAAPSGVVARQVPGAYGQYLVFLGYSADKAIEAARAHGEEPTVRFEGAEMMKHLSSADVHQRFLGYL